MATSGLLSKETAELLEQKRLELMDRIALSPRFWASLVRHKVLSSAEARTMKVGQSSDGKIDDLVEHLIKGTSARYEGFLNALADTDQGFIKTELLQLQSTRGTVFQGNAAGPSMRRQGGPERGQQFPPKLQGMTQQRESEWRKAMKGKVTDDDLRLLHEVDLFSRNPARDAEIDKIVQQYDYRY